MVAHQGRDPRNRALRVWLRFRAHLHAVRREPVSYAQAALWRARRLKVRSRQRFASLLGKSPLAYDLWLQQPTTYPSGTTSLAKVLCVVDCRGVVGADVTRSLAAVSAADWQAVVLGDQADGAEAIISRPSELANLVGSEERVWICAMLPGDLLSEDAPAAYGAAAATADGASILYSDDDLLDDVGRRKNPHFKPDWNSELFFHHDYLTGSCLVTARAEDLATLPLEGWAQALITRAIGSGTYPIHVPKVLHHRRTRPAPQIPMAPLRFAGVDRPTLTCVIPTRNQAVLLRTCLDGVLQTPYPGLKIFIIDNGSDDVDAIALLRSCEAQGIEVLRRPGPFNFSALNNAAAAHVDSDLLCFLNNDVEILSADWLETMAVQAVREEVGAVGARLLYPDGTIQHAGVIIGVCSAAGHAHRFQPLHSPGYFDRINLPQFVSAVTAACLVVSRKKFLSVGGFDETVFPVAFNDVDLCLRLNQKGWQSLYEPRATLLHHESKSRGKDLAPDKRERFARELAALQQRWSTDRIRDPFHHWALSASAEQFVIDLEPL